METKYHSYYAGDVIYTQPVTGVGNAITVEEYEIDGGGGGRIGIYYRPTDISAYQLTDHLGNVRAVVAKSGSTLQVRLYSDYYPYGMVITPQTTGTNDYRYGYQGQYAEKDPETDWNAFELRMYDSKIARWLSVDPKGQFHSPYVSMGNNPVSGVDPDGGFWQELKNWAFNGGMWISNEGLQQYRQLKADGLDPSYKWFGNKLEGHGVLSYTTHNSVSTDVIGESLYGPVINVKKYNAVRDDIMSFEGKRYSVFLDREISITAGLRSTDMFSGPIGGFGYDLNLASWQLYKNSFVFGTSHILSSNDANDIVVTHGVELQMGVAKVGPGLKYNIGLTDAEFNLAYTKIVGGILPVSANSVKNMITKQTESTMGVNIGLAHGIGFDIGVNIKMRLLKD